MISATSEQVNVGETEQVNVSEMEDMEGRMHLLSDPDGIVSEAYRALRTNLLHSFGDNPPGAIVLTGPASSQKHSSACANLAVSFVHVNKRTLIVDCDLRQPLVHKELGLRNVYGLTDVLLESSSLQEALREPLPGLGVLTAGTPIPGTVDLLESSGFDELLATAREEFDVVLLDAPPLGEVSDAAILATKTDGALLLLDARDTRKGPVRQAVQQLKTVGANLLGTVVCDAKSVSHGL
jgi:capsular exopolysaccharide synthesis family protein